MDKTDQTLSERLTKVDDATLRQYARVGDAARVELEKRNGRPPKPALRAASVSAAVRQYLGTVNQGRSNRKDLVSEAYLARKMGVPQKTFNRWARGEYAPRPRYLHALSDLLGVSPQDLCVPGTYTAEWAEHDNTTPTDHTNGVTP